MGPSDFINAGQVILVNVNESTISSLNISYSDSGISLYYCNNNEISGNTANYNNDHGISLTYCNNNNISGNTANNNTGYGIYLITSHNNTITENTLLGNVICIVEENCQGNEFKDNGDCTYGIVGPSEPAIPGINLFILFGILSVVAILITKKVKKS